METGIMPAWYEMEKAQIAELFMGLVKVPHDLQRDIAVVPADLCMNIGGEALERVQETRRTSAQIVEEIYTCLEEEETLEKLGVRESLLRIKELLIRGNIEEAGRAFTEESKRAGKRLGDAFLKKLMKYDSTELEL